MNTGPVTIPDLIERCLRAIHDHFYVDRPVHAFMRDRNALMKAIARYGYECERRGWRFDEVHVVEAILKLLPQIKAPDHQWLPVYLEKCIDRYVGQRSEELQAESRRLDLKAESVIATAAQRREVVQIAAPGTSATELLAQMHRALTAKQREGKAGKKKTREPREAPETKPAPELTLF